MIPHLGLKQPMVPDEIVNNPRHPIRILQLPTTSHKAYFLNTESNFILYPSEHIFLIGSSYLLILFYFCRYVGVR